MTELIEILGVEPVVSLHGDVCFHLIQGEISAEIELLAHGALRLEIATGERPVVVLRGTVVSVKTFSTPTLWGLEIHLAGCAPLFVRTHPNIELCWSASP